jgi:hypothetical protein
MTMTSFLREADFVVTIFANLAVLFVAFPAYKRTKFLPFAFFIWSSFGGLILSAGLHIHHARGFISADDERTFQELYRVGYLVVSILATVGVVLLIRRFLVMLDRKDGHAI